MIIPLEKKPEWRNPPLITLLLIIVNVLCFYIWQHNDNDLEAAARKFYMESDLPVYELPHYAEYLKQEDPANAHLDYNSKQKVSQDNFLLFLHMSTDGRFLNKLHRQEIIKPGDEIYSQWQSQRSHFEWLMNKSTTHKYSLKTASPSLTTLFTHMFLHGDTGHLIGNMIFLFLFGFVVELAVGKKTYLFSYLLAGLFSGIFYVLLDPEKAIGGVGASGAIFGLAGMYTILFGMRKIRFFYTLLFYFDYIKAPAIILVPVWLGFELYSQFFTPSNINNLAHIGGLIAGVIIAFIAKRYTNTVNLGYLESNENTEQLNQRLKNAMNLITQLEFEKAREILLQIQDEYPENIDVRIQLFRISKISNNPDDIHLYAANLLQPDIINKLSAQEAHRVYSEYRQQTNSAMKLNLQQLSALLSKFISGNFLDDAEKIISLLLAKGFKQDQFSQMLQILSNKYSQKGHTDRAEKCQALLAQYFPENKPA